MFSALNAYSGSVQAISTIFLVGITACYVVLTRGLARAANEQLQARREAAKARRQELQALTKFLLEALLSLPISSDGDSYSGTLNIGAVKMESCVRWDDFDFDRFIALAAEASSRAGESATTAKIKMAALGRRVSILPVSVPRRRLLLGASLAASAMGRDNWLANLSGRG